MATFVLTDAFVSVNAVDLSNHVQSVQITESLETQDNTAMGNSARSNSAGLFADAISITFLQDFAAGSVDVTLAGLFRAKTSHDVLVRPTSAIVGATNPKYTLTGYIESYNPISGSVGDQATADASWVNGSTTGLVRATA